MFTRTSKLLAAGILATAVAGGTAAAAGAPPPKAASGRTVQTVATGLQTTTSFAFGAGQVFAAEVPSATSGGGVYALRGGVGVKVGNLPAAFGLAWHKNALYVSTPTSLVRMSKWNGTTFAKQTTLYTAPRKFSGFNGIGFGADGRLYVGVGLSQTNDHSPPTTPYEYDLLSFKDNGKGLKVVATGIRQPWQMVFPAGSSSPYVTDLGQDLPQGIKADDFLLRVKPGQAYGFPSCNWTSVSACRGYAKPFQFFSPHTDIGGLAIAGGRLFISEFGFASNPRVISEPLGSRGPVKVVLSGFAAPDIALGIHAGYLYSGDVAGDVYRVKL